MSTNTETKPAAQIGDTAWYLTKILHTNGSCDHCGRSLKHLYEVVNPDGREMTVGRGCVKNVTGWTLSYAQAHQALRSAARWAEMQAAYAQAKEEGFDPSSGYCRVPMAQRTKAAIFTTALDYYLWRGDAEWREYLQRSVEGL